MTRPAGIGSGQHELSEAKPVRRWFLRWSNPSTETKTFWSLLTSGIE